MDEDLRQQADRIAPEEAPDGGRPEQADDDTQGNSLFTAELHRQVATTRSREASEWARSESSRKQARQRDDRKR